MDQLLHDAEVAMHRAKREQTGHALFDADADYAATHRLARIADLRAAIENRQLFVQYQPVVDMFTGETRSVEALVRWRHPSRGFIAPGEFIALAEECGLISEVTRFVVEQVLTDARNWRAHGHHFRCAVNVSPRCLVNPETVDRLVRTFTGSAEVLTLEVTESVMAEDRAVAVLERLRAGGVQCAIDDFGTGYSSLYALKRLPVSVLKLDRALLRDIAVDQRDVGVVAGVVQIAEALGLTIIAEGMEDAPTARLLRDAGITLAQGYFFAHPMDSDQLLGWLAAGPCPVPPPALVRVGRVWGLLPPCTSATLAQHL